MTNHFPILIEREQSGAFSGTILGLSIHAQGATRSHVERRLQVSLRDFLILYPHPDVTPVNIKVAVVERFKSLPPRVRIVGPMALNRAKTPARVAAARINGRLGGRPRKLVNAGVK